MTRAWTFAALLLAAGCGTGTDGKPVTPPSTPAPPAPEPPPPPPPPPEPPPESPTLRAVAWLLSVPSDPGGYYAGEQIRVVVEFAEAVTVEGSPRLGIEIGEHLRFADFSPWIEDDFPPERPSFLQRFEYEVGPDDVDQDGISVPADAFDFTEGALMTVAGAKIEVEIHAVAPVRNAPNPSQPGKPLDTHRVIGTREPPTLRAEAWLLSVPSDPGGYYASEEIRVVVEFAEAVTVEGSPRLGIEIGEHLRFADFSPWIEDDFPPERPSFLQRFEYEVGSDDVDQDGISVPADAFDFTEGALMTVAGAKIEVEIYSVAPVRNAPNPSEPGEPLDTHRVRGTLEPRVCTTERRFARRYHDAVLVREWDGTPFRFYWDAGIPEGERADAEHFFGVVERLAERIEAQLGYPVLEIAGWVAEDERGFQIGRTDVRNCEGVRPEGIVATVIPERTPFNNLVIARARPSCAVVYWTRNDVDTTLDGVMDHELFHLFGFQHSPESNHPFKSPRGTGTPMTVHLTNSGDATPADIDALGCVFPHADFPRE